MSRNRVNPEAGWANIRALPKAPSGRRLCRRCGQECPKRRRTFCSGDCVHRWRLTSDPAYLRAQVRKRDKEVCHGCGLDIRALRREVERLPFDERAAFLRARGFSAHASGGGDYWQADHIVEVVRGGGECGLDNLQTLCTPCHKAKTRRLAAELARQRRAEREADAMPLLAAQEVEGS